MDSARSFVVDVAPEEWIHCIDTGGDGPPVVILHGLAGSSREFFATAGALPEFRTVLVDLHGHGHCTRIPGDLSREAFVADVLGERLRVIGGVWVAAGVQFVVLPSRTPFTVPCTITWLSVLEMGIFTPGGRNLLVPLEGVEEPAVAPGRPAIVACNIRRCETAEDPRSSEHSGGQRL
jgi:hypothetical protein